MVYGDGRIGPTHLIITQEEAERRARDFLDKAERGGHIKPQPLGYVVLVLDHEDRWQDNWDGRVHSTRQSVEIELEEARMTLGYDQARIAVLMPVEPEG